MTSSLRPSSSTVQGNPSSISQRLLVEASIVKSSAVGHSLLGGLGSDKLTKSAVRFDDAKDQAAKESYKRKQKQAWDSSPPDTPRQLSSSLSNHHTNESKTTPIKKIQDFLYPEHLKELRRRFQNAPQYMNNKLDLDSFIDFFRSLPEMRGKSDLEIKSFFDKIDCYSEGKIDWDEFCTYMYLELYEKEDAKSKAKEVVFSMPAVTVGGPHKDSLCSIYNLQDGTIVSCSQDGIVSFWTNDLRPKKIRKTEAGLTGKPKWISDMSLAVPQGKLILTTGDKEILFLEMVNFEPYCQISNLDSTPLKLDFWSNPDNNSECLILVGDDQGSITIISISNIYETFKIMKLGVKKHGIPSFPIDRFLHGDCAVGVKIYRWALHSSWVTKVRYYDKLRVFVSASNDSNASLVMGTPAGSTPVDAILYGHQKSRRAATRMESGGGRVRSSTAGTSSLYRSFCNVPAKKRLPGDQKVFRVNKGVTTFDFCQVNNVLVTGGLDQIIYIWNPYVSERPIGVLYGQASPVYCIQLDSVNNRIYSISNDNTIKVWDLVDQSCLATATATAHKVYATVEAFYFNPVKQYLIVGTDQVHVIHISVMGSLPKANTVLTHRLPVSCTDYSFAFGLVITACEESVVKVWDITNGECVFEFASVHGNSPITAIDIDQSGRRLATAAQNGEIKIWNFNNGHCLLSLDKGNSYEVTDLKFVSINQLKYLIAVGWDRAINVFFDTFEPGEVHSSITSLDRWSKASSQVHREDITCITMCHSTMLATASFDGEIILWNMISGQMIQRIQAKHHSSSTEAGDNVINKLAFLHTRKRHKTAASLVASGPAGNVYFWNIYDSKKPMGHYQATQFKCLTDMSVDSADTILITADIEGFIAQWDIRQYCINNLKTYRCLRKWRAHSLSINSVSLLEEYNLLITASNDCSVRVWTEEGHYIGTLGQRQSWDISNTGTYQHPLTPKDVLIDPLTVPSFITSTEDKREEEGEGEGEDGEGERVMTPIISDIENELMMMEEEEKDKTMLESYGLSYEVPRLDSPDLGGKRLRHLRSHSAKSPHRPPPAAGSYASLLYQELNQEPNFQHTLNNITSQPTGKHY